MAPLSCDRLSLVVVVVVILLASETINSIESEVDCDRLCRRFVARRNDYFACLFGCEGGRDESVDADVRDEALSAERFEIFPFPPPRSDIEEGRNASLLAEINHYCFGGRRDFCSATDAPFRILVAGGGTGVDTVRLAAELTSMRAFDWEIVHLDRSRSALVAAEMRINASGLSGRVRFVRESLLAVSQKVFGSFDYIHVTGVLHHVTNPKAGMRALSSILRPDGCIHGMVYGVYGRTGIYNVQRALRTLAPATFPWKRRLSVARALLGALPVSNWLRMDDVRWSVLTRNESAHDIYGNDVLLADLLLPAVDRPFTVRGVASMLAQSEMELVGFHQPAVYDPTLHLQRLVESAEGTTERGMLEDIERMSYLDRCALAEQIGGNLQQHWFYARKRGSNGSVASMSDLSLIPILVGRGAADRRGGALAQKIRGSGMRLTWRYQSMTYDFECSPAMLRILEEIDGRRSIGAIFSGLLQLPSSSSSHTIAELAEGWAMLFVRLNGIHHLFLSSTPAMREGTGQLARCEEKPGMRAADVCN